MSFLSRIFYMLTAYLPRNLPDSPEKYSRFKAIMVHAYGVEDTAQAWTIIAGQMTAHNPQKKRAAWGSIANAAKHMKIVQISRLAQAQAQALTVESMAKTQAQQKHVKDLVLELLKDETEETITEIIETKDSVTLKHVAMEAMSLEPAQGTLADWMSFIKATALELNVERVKEADHEQTESLAQSEPESQSTQGKEETRELFI